MKNTRRKFIHTCLGLVGGSLVLHACGSGENQQGREEAFTGDPCDDMREDTEEELAKRKQLRYVEKSHIPESRCDNCQLYIPPKSDRPRGGCMLVTAPVHA